MYTGDVKFTGFSSPFAEDALRSALRSGTPLPEESVNGRGLSDLLTKYRVTADPRRAPFTPIEYMRRHRDPAYLGAGPVGHGFTEEAIAAGRGYYTFPTFPTAASGTAARVTGIALDSTNRAGYTAGSPRSGVVRMAGAHAQRRQQQILRCRWQPGGLCG